MTVTRTSGPRIIIEDAYAPRLEPAMPVVDPPVDPAPRAGGASLALAGVTILAVGLAGLQTANFAVDQFNRSVWLGTLTTVVAVAGFGLLGAAAWRELRGLFALSQVDRLRAALGSGDASRIHAAARSWAATLPDAARLLPAIDAANDPDAILALLRTGPVAEMQAKAEAIGRTAAVQMVAGVAATPAPALAVLLVAWRGVRLVRQVAALYGMRPGLLGTLGLLRRSVLSAGLVAGSEVAINAAAHALLSNPLLTHALGKWRGRGSLPGGWYCSAAPLRLRAARCRLEGRSQSSTNTASFIVRRIRPCAIRLTQAPSVGWHKGLCRPTPRCRMSKRSYGLRFCHRDLALPLVNRQGRARCTPPPGLLPQGRRRRSCSVGRVRQSLSMAAAINGWIAVSPAPHPRRCPGR